MFYPNFYNNAQAFVPVYENNGKSTLRKRFIMGIFDLIGMAICFIAFGIVYAALDPKNRYYTCDMSDVSFPQKDDSVPFWAVGLYGVIGPVLVIIFVEILNAQLCPCQSSKNISFKNRLRKFGIFLFHALSLFVFGISITLLLTEIGKRWIGRFRPHFLTVCNPTVGTITCTTDALKGTIYNAIDTSGSFCTGDSSKVKEARLSFPSGHASFSTYTMLFLIIYLEARFLTIKFRSIKALIQLAAFIAAFITSISRISDYHHRGSDVIGGIVLGALIALFLTLVIGRILWMDRMDYYDYDYKPDDSSTVPNNQLNIPLQAAQNQIQPQMLQTSNFFN